MLTFKIAMTLAFVCAAVSYFARNAEENARTREEGENAWFVRALATVVGIVSGLVGAITFVWSAV